MSGTFVEVSCGATVDDVAACADSSGNPFGPTDESDEGAFNLELSFSVTMVP